MPNRYVSKERMQFIMREVERKFTYSPPDTERKLEHELLNDAFMDLAKLIARTCPDSEETELAKTYLWLARAAANGSIATFPSEELKHVEQRRRSSETAATTRYYDSLEDTP